ncbi:hypothetical protein DMJ13_19915 [halophilic archaeon]|nr:hypothetical protein DMJ13_19915 [halophilic archaeon]
MINASIFVVADMRASDPCFSTAFVTLVAVDGRERSEGAVIGGVVDADHVFAVGVVVDVMWAGAGEHAAADGVEHNGV